MQQRHPWLLTLVLMTFVSSTFAQKSAPNFKKRLDEALSAINKVDIAKAKEIKTVADDQLLKEATDIGLAFLDAETARMKKEIDDRKKAYLPPASSGSAGLDREFMKLIADMPEPIISLHAAKKAMKAKPGEDIFALYIKKVEAYQEQLKEEILKNAASFTTMPNSYKAKQDLQNNPMIQQMGGLEKLQNMSPEERQALAKKMAEKMKQNPSAYNGQESDPKKAFTQKMLKDATFAAKFNHMTVPQQQEEYELFKKENGFVDNEPKKTSNAALTITIDQKITGIFNHRQELSQTVAPLQTKTEEHFAALYKNLDEQLDAQVKALPVVEHGEAGSGKDTRPLDIAYNIVLYPIKVQEAMANKNIWASQLSAIKVTIAEYDEFLGAYWGKNKTTDQLMAQRNQTPPAILSGICNEVIQLTKLAKAFTNMSASAQRAYDEKVLQFFE
ncbi:hypothetical protein GFS24_11650 [Chitinophaga sp. SYP-B3965]|uniref:hypothetical protein n=1 Tax=Chitinophaga sp. SYP-B3965 TaxID=2663120 RepID=UPI001299DE5B|nr:hypothetical protein [Chitinophaga sp. SYP-B3965]MRG45773.1 hypothetical protein [Chitinophaga sp. SYP-B3965]